MAPLNPTIQPTNDPNYRGYSQPISVPDTIKPQGVQTNSIMPQGQQIGDRSAEYQGKSEAYKMAADSTSQEAYGDLFKNITEMGAFVGKAGVAVVKKDIEDKVYEIADRERQQYTATLEQMKASGQTQNIFATSSDPEVPQDVQDLGDHLSTLRSARDGGKISSTYYESRLLSEAKKLRAQYPGFRNEIDQEFAKVTGSNPANAYIRALTSDINRSANSASSELKKAESFILQRNGYPGARQILDKVRTGQATLSDVVDWASPYDAESWEINTENARINNSKLTREENQAKKGLFFDKVAGKAVGRVADQLAADMGITSAEDAARLETATKTGAMNSQNWLAMSQRVAQEKVRIQVLMRNQATQAGMVETLGMTEVNRKIDEATKPLDWLQDRIFNKDYGGFYQAQQDIKAMNNDAQRAMLQHPKIGPILQMTNAVKELGGESNVVTLSQDIIKGDFPQSMKTYAKQWQLGFATQYNLRHTGIPVTFNDALDDIREKAKTDPSMNNKRMNKYLMNEVTKITRPDISDDIKKNYALAAFSPQNRGMLSKLSADGYDARGNAITGQAAVFQNFTSPEMTKEMWRLGQKDPQVWKNYTDWAQETIASDLANRDINSLAVIRNPSIHVGWDSENKRLVARADVTEAMRYRTGGGSVINPELDPEYQNVQRTVNRMNGYLSNYKNIAEASGVPVDAFLIKTIAAVNPEAVRNTQSIPYQLLRDLGLSQLKGRQAGPR